MIARRMLLAGAMGGLAVSRGAAAQDAAAHLTFIIPYASGGGFDAYVRAVIPALQQCLGREVVPNNVDGAGGARAANMLVRAKPDGTVVSIVNIPGALILQQQGGLGFDLGQLSWLCNMGRDAYGLVVPVDSPYRTLDDLRALGRRRPVKFTCIGPAGTGYSATRIGTKLLDIPARIIAGYKGTNDYIVAALRGDGDAAVASLTALAQFLKSRMVRALVTFEAKSSLPGVPDATDLGLPELADIVQLRPVAGPPGLAPDIAHGLSNALVQALKASDVIAWARRNSANLQPDDAAETARLFAEQARFIAKWKSYLTA